MATSSHAKTLLGGVPAELKTPLHKVVEYIFDRTMAFGPISATDPRTATTNFAGRYLRVTTSGTANQEFTVAHGLGRTPNVCWQVGHPRVVNSRFLGDLTFARAADDNRIYMTSASTGATFFLYCE